MKASGPLSKIVAQSLDLGNFLRNRRELIQAMLLLQADQPNTRKPRQGKVFRQGDRSSLINLALRIALPGNADS